MSLSHGQSCPGEEQELPRGSFWHRSGQPGSWKMKLLLYVYAEMLNLYFQTNISGTALHFKNTVFAGCTNDTSPSEGKEIGMMQLLHCKFLFSITLEGSYWYCGNALYQLYLCPPVLSNHHFTYTSELLVFQKMLLVSSQLHQTNLATIIAYIPSLKSSVDIIGIMLTENFAPDS